MSCAAMSPNTHGRCLNVVPARVSALIDAQFDSAKTSQVKRLEDGAVQSLD